MVTYLEDCKYCVGELQFLTHLNKLQDLQNRTTRIVTSSSKETDDEDLYFLEEVNLPYTFAGVLREKKNICALS